MSDTVRFERVVRAAPERVFDAFLSPRGQAELYGQDVPGWIVESACDARVGGEWTIAFGPSRDELYHHRHVFEVLDRPRLVALSTTETRLDGATLVTRMEFRFERHEGGTLMTLVHTGFPTPALRDEHLLGVPNAFARFARAAES